MEEPGELQPPGAQLKKLARQGGQLIFLDLVISICEAGAAMKLWNWFVVPLGTPALSVTHAFGLMLLLSFVHGAVAYWPAPSDGTSDVLYKQARTRMMYRFVRITFFLPLGWIAYHLMR